MAKPADKAGGSRRNLNAVEVNAQWVEAIKKEMNHH